MASISKEKTAEIRANIKAKFPTKDGWKISISRKDFTVLKVAILEAPVLFTEAKHTSVNQYQLDSYSNSDMLKMIIDICNEGNHDHSDPMTDYFDVGWYFRLSIGTWEKPFKLN